MKDKNQSNNMFTQPLAGVKTECGFACPVEGIILGVPQSIKYDTARQNISLTITTEETAGRDMLLKLDKTTWELRIPENKDGEDRSTLVATLHAIEV